MEYTEAIAVRKRQISGQPVDSEQVRLANQVIAATRALAADYGIALPREPAPVQHRIADRPAPQQPARPALAPALMQSIVPPMSARCECGLRYGMHRVSDYACPNQNWRPGNGQPQWLPRKWKRA